VIQRYFPVPSVLRQIEPERFPSLTFGAILWSPRMLRQIEADMTQPRQSGCWLISRLPSGELAPIERPPSLKRGRVDDSNPSERNSKLGQSFGGAGGLEVMDCVLASWRCGAARLKRKDAETQRR
jgi:hypothetical protein